MTTPMNSGVSMSHAVSRTAELLSCARTALKIARSNLPPPTELDWWAVEPSQLQLYTPASNTKNKAYSSASSSLEMTLEDALSLLRAMHGALESLEGLVRRRGHTNDPTMEIAVKTKQLETDAQELNVIIQQLQSTRSISKQHKKHLEWIATWLQTVASQQSVRLKEVLKVRGTVLADQAQRRKLWNPQASAHKNNAAVPARTGRKNTAALQKSPLFTMTPTVKPKSTPTTTNAGPPQSGGNGVGSGSNGNSHMTTNGSHTASGSIYGINNGAYGGRSGNTSVGGYGGGYGGYYGGIGAPTSTGMRQRRSNNSTSSDSVMIQEQVQIRQQQRLTQDRLESAKQAESSLAELSTLFGKMSSLIVQQGETLEKVEDDVEAALVDVSAGQAEIQTLYSLKKGNRGLIIKTFAVVIFVILFMRLY